MEAPFGLPHGVTFCPDRDFKRPSIPITVPASASASASVSISVTSPVPPVPVLQPADAFTAPTQPHDMPVDPSSSQLKALCKRLHPTASAGRHMMLAPGPSATMTMQARASGKSTPRTITAMASTTPAQHVHGTAPTNSS